MKAQELHPGLWQGSWPPPGPWLAQRGFTTLVLCAFEYQPPHYIHPNHAAHGALGTSAANPWPGVEVIYAPNDDDFEQPPSREVLRLAIKAGRIVAARLAQKRKVLVTCNMGKNRSGLVSALGLHLHLGISGEAATRIVQTKRTGGLRNPRFIHMLSKLRRPEPEVGHLHQAVPAKPTVVQAYLQRIAALRASQPGLTLPPGVL